MIYNHQLCLIDRGLWPFAVKSISDWKNEYHPECLRAPKSTTAAVSSTRRNIA